MVEKKLAFKGNVKSLANSTQSSVTANTLSYNETAIQNNFNVLEYSRTCQSAASGITSGILGLTGTYGFLFYFACVLIQAICWEYKSGFRWNDFFTTRSLSVSHSLISGLFTYVLFWVFIYGIVHVY